MLRSNTARSDSLTINRPNQDVTFVFQDVSKTGLSAKIYIPEDSKWTPSPHWHERYTEYLRVVRGRLRVIIDGTARVVTPEDGEQRVERFAVHEFMRADVDTSIGQGDAGDVVVEERTDPADGMKEVFFRNVLSVVEDARTVYGRTTGLQITLTCAAFDNFDVYGGGPLSWHVTHGIHALARIVGRLAGMSAWYEEYTPQRIRNVAESAAASWSMRKSL